MVNTGDQAVELATWRRFGYKAGLRNKKEVKIRNNLSLDDSHESLRPYQSRSVDLPNMDVASQESMPLT